MSPKKLHGAVRTTGGNGVLFFLDNLTAAIENIMHPRGQGGGGGQDSQSVYALCSCRLP